MHTRSKYYPMLGSLLGAISFTVAEAASRGVPRQALAYLVNLGYLERLASGVYRSTAIEPDVDVPMAGLALMASTIPHAVICLTSALVYYDLTDEIAREYWLAIPHSQRAPVRLATRIIRTRNIKLGKTRIKLGTVSVMIFDRERCIVDAFRYLSREIAIKALKAYLADRTYRPDLQKLSRYATILRVNIRPYLLALLT